MSLTLQTIEELEATMKKGTSATIIEQHEFNMKAARNLEALLSAARWALERGYGQGDAQVSE